MDGVGEIFFGGEINGVIVGVFDGFDSVIDGVGFFGDVVIGGVVVEDVISIGFCCVSGGCVVLECVDYVLRNGDDGVVVGVGWDEDFVVGVFLSF